MASWFYLYLYTANPMNTDSIEAKIRKESSMSTRYKKQNDIHIDEGTSHWITVSVVDENNEQMNLEGCSAIFTSEHFTGMIEKSCIIDGNEILVKLNPSETKNCTSRWYQIRVFDSEGDIFQIIQGIIYISKAHKPYIQNPLGGE